MNQGNYGLNNFNNILGLNAGLPGNFNAGLLGQNQLNNQNTLQYLQNLQQAGALNNNLSSNQWLAKLQDQLLNSFQNDLAAQGPNGSANAANNRQEAAA